MSESENAAESIRRVLQQAPKILRASGWYPFAVTKWGFFFLPRFSQGCHKREALPAGNSTAYDEACPRQKSGAARCFAYVGAAEISGVLLFLRPCRGERIRVVAFANQLDYLILGGIKIDSNQILAILRGDDLLAQ